MNEATLRWLAGNAVVYSQNAWAVARKASGGDNLWFIDSGAWSKPGSVTSEQLLDWVDDWVLMLPATGIKADQ